MRRQLRALRHSRGLASILRNGSWQSLMVGYNFALRLVYVLAVSLLLGAEDYGFFAYAQTFYISFLPLVLLGLDVILPREIGKSGTDAKALLQRSFSLRLALGIGFSLVAACIGVASEADAAQQSLLALISMSLMARGFQGWCGAVLLGFERSRIQMLMSSIFRSAEVLAGIAALLFFEAGLWALICIHVLSWFGYALLNCVYIHRHLVPLRFCLSVKAATEMMGENIVLALQMFCGSLIINGVLIIYKHTASDAEAFGQFALAFMAVRIFAEMLEAFNSAAAPVLARSHLRGDLKDIRFALGASFLFWWIGAALLLLMWLCGAPLFLVLMGDAYKVAAGLINIMALWLPFYVAKVPIYLFLRTRMQHRAVLCEQLLHMLMMVLGLFLFGYREAQGMIEAFAFASAISYVFLLWRWRQSWR